MEWLLFWVFVIWLIGYSMGRKNKNQVEEAPVPREDSLRRDLKTELETLASNTHDSKIAEGIRRAGRYLVHEPLVPKLQTLETEAAKLQPAMSAAHQPSVHEWRDLMPGDNSTTPAAVEGAEPKPASWATRDIRSIDSVSLLLYFGAFLVIAGVGLFVGLSDVDGAVKTISVLALALGLYGTGLYLYQRIERLRPAAITITAIGLISLPLTGVAAYTYLTNQTFGPLIWCMTSLLCFGLYMLALWKMRQSLIGYLSVFMCLSLWMSIVAVVDAPVYFFGWAMIVLAMLYLLIGKFTKLWPEVEAPLNTSASVMVPTAVVLMLLFGGGAISQLHQGITVLLSAAFYAIACMLEQRPKERHTYFVLSYLLLPLGAVLISYDLSREMVMTSFTLTGVSILQLAAVDVLRKRMPANWLESSLIVNAIALGLAAFLCASSADWNALAILLSINLATHAAAGITLRNKVHMALGLIATLILPALIGFLVIDPAAGKEWVAGAYILLGLALMAASRVLAHIVGSYRQMAIAGYGSAFMLAWLIGGMGSAWVPAATSASVALAVLVSAYFERVTALIFVAAGLGVLSGLQALHWSNVHATGGDLALVVGSLGVAYYAAAKLHERLPNLTTFHSAWMYSGLVALYGGSIAGFLQSGTSWPAIAYLALAGFLTSFEAYRRHEKAAMYVGGAVILAAVQCAMYHLDFSEWQVYWYMWTAYPLFIAYRERVADWIYPAALILVIGVFEGLLSHDSLTLLNGTLALSGLGVVYYIAGKVHALGNQPQQAFVRAWTICGLAGLYGASALRFFGFIYADESVTMLNAVALMMAGGLTSYEAYIRRNRAALYFGGGVSLVGLQWLMHLQQINEVQIYTHMWAAYFALLAWLSARDKRSEEKTNFTILALTIQTLPLAWEGLQGDTGYGLLLLLESIAIMLFGLWIKYSLVTKWGLAVAVGSVLYQLRDLQFFLLVLLGAGIIGLSVYLLLRKGGGK
jgi:hypothetical protein